MEQQNGVLFSGDIKPSLDGSPLPDRNDTDLILRQADRSDSGPIKILTNFQGKQARMTIGLILAYLVCIIIITYPAIFHLSDRVIGDGGDNYQFLAFQWLANHQFENGMLPFGWTNYWRYPVGFDFDGSYDSTLLLMLGILLYRFTASPVVVYNLSLFIILVLNCYLSYLFFAKAVNDRRIGFIGGCIYGLSFYVIARLGGHPNLLLTGSFPFIGYALLLLRERKADTVSVWVMASSVTLVFLGSLQHLLILLGSLIFMLPVFTVSYFQEVRSLIRHLLRAKQDILLSILAVFLIFMFFHSGKVFAVLNNTLLFPNPEIVSVDPVNIVIPNAYLRTLSSSPLVNGTKQWIEYVTFIGYVELLLIAAFFISPLTSSRFRKTIGILSALFILLTIGGGLDAPAILPYPYLFKILPFRGIVEPGRFIIIASIFLVLGMCLVLKQWKTKGYLLAAAILCLVLIERLPTEFYLSGTLAHEPFISEVRKSQSQAVLDLPLFLEWWNGQKYDMYSIYYEKPIVNGYIHWLGDTEDSKRMLAKMNYFACSTDPGYVPKAFTVLELERQRDNNKLLYRDLLTSGIRTVVYHKDFSEGEKGCENANLAIQQFLNTPELNMRITYDDDKKKVYQLENDL